MLSLLRIDVVLTILYFSWLVRCEVSKSTIFQLTPLDVITPKTFTFLVIYLNNTRDKT